MRHLFEEGARKGGREKGRMSGSFSVWLFLSYGALFFYFHLFSIFPSKPWGFYHTFTLA